jgi:hypothetical protein
LIGTNATGTAAMANGDNGITVSFSAGNTIGGSVAGVRNIISGNNTGGVDISGSGANSNWVAGNFIGTDLSDTVRIGNGGGAGVAIHGGAQFNVVGTNGDGINDGAEGNVISGNGGGGPFPGFGPGSFFDNVDIWDPGTDHNVVAGNFIGTDATGTQAIGSNGPADGVAIVFGAQFNRIGTNADGISDALERNIISGNPAQGVELDFAGTQYNMVAGNYIGTDVTGIVALPNGVDGVC